MRGVLLGLLLSNIVFMAWNVFTPGLVPVLPERADQVIDSTTLPLLSEIDEARLIPYPSREELLAGAEPINSAELMQESEAQYCAEIGPFRSVEDAQGFVLTNTERMTLVVDEREVPAAPDHRVYLPPFSSRELAQSTLATLQAQFAANDLAIDTYLMPRGELANGIALGLFSEHSNALNVQRQMEVLGYKVVVRTEPKQELQVWVLATGLSSAQAFSEHWAQMRLSRSYVDTREKLCETIAHAQ